MGGMLPIIAVITRETRLSRLRQRWTTKAGAEFRLQHAADHELMRRRERRAAQGTPGDLQDDAMLEDLAEALADHETLDQEDRVYQHAVQRLVQALDIGVPVMTVDREFLPNFDFHRCLAAVVIGPDGLVANAAKYAEELPLIGINPDPARYDGILLPFSLGQAREVVQHVLHGKARIHDVTMAEVNTNDGQRMLAFNDFFVGCNSHISARYTLELGGHHESQSSSGVLISTGAGATGWLSSVFNMAQGISRIWGSAPLDPPRIAWDDRQLAWVVREPFLSRHSDAGMVAGLLPDGQELVIGSQMPAHGVIFSDGVETDFLEFNAGTIASFSVSTRCARLVVP